MMELLMMVVGLVGFALAAGLGGADSRPRLDDEPRRAI
jgi:hypothetical protein